MICRNDAPGLSQTQGACQQPVGVIPLVKRTEWVPGEAQPDIRVGEQRSVADGDAETSGF